ncbi:MAG: 4-(cytidine 5'-diphospho)-2-C-methyl-D-erythritol kinase [Succinivibrio sp.]|nr:4-(cytidine 5'-diphospho)-2-C-methyl-D-erythritol kinase [Succinivibrio sp.]
MTLAAGSEAATAPGQELEFTCTCPCKLNLFLYITGRRPDGYHNLQTLFVVLNYGDRLSVKVLPHSDLLSLKCDLEIPPEHNLALKAARALLPYRRNGAGVSMTLRKVLPPGGGIGAGSANAAAVLLILNELWDCRLAEGQLIDLAAALGADVPVFIKGTTCLGEGIGEILTEVDYPQRWYTVCNPGCKVPTAQMFASALLKKDFKPKSLTQLLRMDFDNCFTAVTTALFPQVAALLKLLENCPGCVQHGMSGSGSSCFAAFDSENAAKECCAKLKRQGLAAFTARSCLKNPVKAALSEGLASQLNCP